MSKRCCYNTKQKDLIVEKIKSKKKSFTIKQLYDDLNGSIGLTTIYRTITKLLNEGLLDKTIGSDNTAFYQYLEKCSNKNHFFLKCESCGNLEHVDCDCIENLTKHIKKEHKFSLNQDRIVINGICKKCRSDINEK